MARGYFRNKIPFDWGHLTDSGYSHKFDCNPDLTEVDQALLIAKFWGRVARIAQQMHELDPDRVMVVRVAEMFQSPLYVADALTSAGLKISRTEMLGFRDFSSPKNASPTRAMQFMGIDWDLIESAATETLSSEFKAELGL